jgi:hypothetical protein
MECTRRVVTASALVIAIVVGGCGGGGGPALSRGAFIAKANKECDSLKQASDDFHAAQQPSATGQKVAKFLRAAADRLRQLVQNVGDLVPPASLQGKVDALLKVLGEYADGLDSLASHTQSGQRFQEVLDANAKTVDRLNGLATRAGQLVVNLELTACAPPS